MHHTRSVLCLTSLAAVVASAAGADELARNGHFDESVVEWSAPAAHVTLSYDTLDVDASEDSGSARVTTMAIGSSTRRGSAQQCVDVVGDDFYDASAFAQTPAGQNRQGIGRYLVDWYDLGSCTGDLIQTDGVGQLAATDIGAWRLLAPGDSLLSPVDARSAMLRLEVQQDVYGGSVSILFDDVSFVPEPGAAASAGAVLLALCALRRRRR